MSEPAESIGAFKTRVRNLLIEYGLETFVVVGYRGQDAFEMVCVRGERDRNALDRLYEQKYQRDFAVTEYETEWVEEEED